MVTLPGNSHEKSNYTHKKDTPQNVDSRDRSLNTVKYEKFGVVHSL